MDENIDRTLDATGLNCPMPLLKTKQALAEMNSGERLHVMATDPGSWRDLDSFVALSGHAFASREERDGLFHYVLIKG
ncbi:tRNA 2-thiouridine synthesizing protein A [Kushneria sinocarnis]|uniref:tRNA 2-thiouridine synthesizing protein A n=1 Tax=Kushneria sinocarnis TaxID=595502 RepID=A0A420WZG7_9GAMM|nr:sulfurtransferase TusA family protein [Kushneria sinocarnis]RKR06664.1 tRNA 2-thiouridine synthesizing protein A [Kushneria sinocarnis]